RMKMMAIIVDATYENNQLPEYLGNPLVEALPPIISDREVLLRLILMPDYDRSERSLPAEIREKLVNRIKKLIQPLPEYLKCYRAMETALIDSYSSKNPFSPTTSHYLHYL